MEDYMKLLEDLRYNYDFNLSFTMVSLLKKCNPSYIKKVYTLHGPFCSPSKESKKDPGNESLIGYAVIVGKPDGNGGEQIWLEFLDISIHFQRNGNGTKLLHTITKDFKEVYVQLVLFDQKGQFYDSHHWYRIFNCGRL